MMRHLCYLWTAAALAQPITLQSPQDYQVFQRQSKTQGKILVAGRVDVPCDRVEGSTSGKWQPISYRPESHVFFGDLPTPAGGWYRFELRILNSAATVGRLEVAHVGVGEVFIVAGQSNSTNYGEVRQLTASGMVAAFGRDTWALADDPQPGVQDGSKNGSFIPSFGDALYEKYRVPVGVVSVGHGSTSVRQWLPAGSRIDVPPTMGKFIRAAADNTWECDGTLFDGMMRAILRLLPHGFRALLWHQGESDAHQAPEHEISAENYRSLMEQIIRASRREAGWDFPWFVAQATYHSPNDTSCPEIRDAQKSIWRSGLALEGPDTDQLTGDNRQNNGKGVHMSAKGLQAHGRMWAEKVEAWLDTVLAN
jgi:hypothetical protein